MEKTRKYMGFIGLAFGSENIIKREEFVEVAMSKRCNWIFSDYSIRLRIKNFLEPGILEEYEE